MATRSARTADKTTNDKHTRILKTLLQKPENKFCVDCRKKDPRWASFNIGCFMCIRCSGVHRSMGTHISKVKSVDLDSWTAEQVENMIKWGNGKVNKYWEARLPEANIPNENTSGIDQWIRSKYEWKQFANKESIPDPIELGPVDEALLLDLQGKTGSRHRVNRLSGSSESFGIIAPPPGNASARSSISKRPTSVLGGVQGADLFSIGQQHPSPTASQPTAAQEDLFGFNDPVPTNPVTQQPQFKRNSIQSVQSQQQLQTQSSTAQDLFSLMSPSTLSSSPSANSQPSQVAPTTASSPSAPAKAANTDWKNSIMSLYGNQSSGSNRHSTGLNISTQQQQQQPGQFGQFGQLQSMKTFGIGQQSSQPQQPQFQQPHFHQSQPQPQQNHWGNNSAFGATLQVASGAPSSFSGFDTFNSTGSNPGFGIQAANGLNKPGSTFGHNNVSGFNSSNNNTNSNINTNTSNVPPGGDLFSMIAGATPSPVTSSSAQNRKNSAFGDLTWN